MKGSGKPRAYSKGLTSLPVLATGGLQLDEFLALLVRGTVFRGLQIVLSFSSLHLTWS